MTAVCLITQSDSVTLAVDGATFDPMNNWRVLSIGSKVEVSDDADVAWTLRGTHRMGELIKSRMRRVTGLDAALRLMPDGIRLAQQYLRKSIPGYPADMYEGIMALIGWSDERSTFEAWTIATFDREVPALTPVRSDIVFGGPWPFDSHDGLWDEIEAVTSIKIAAQIDWDRVPAATIAGVMMDRQRTLLVKGENGTDAYLCGGFAEMVTISHVGLERRRIREWPDVVGEPISLGTVQNR